MAFGPRPKPLADRFWPKIKKAGPGECWEWVAKNADQHGYGRIWYQPLHKSVRASRIMWLLTHGVLPPSDEFVLHRCDNPKCVNPNHLFLGDQDANMKDAKAKGRVRGGSRHGMAKLTEETVRQIRHANGTLEDVGRRFGISAAQISAIQLGILWPNAGGPIRQNRRPGIQGRMNGHAG